MEIVINEWYLDWHRPNASSKEQAAARVFLSWFRLSEQRLVVLRDSPFTQKLNDYRRNFAYHPMCKIYLKLFFRDIFDNPEKCRILETPPDLPADILEKLSIGNFASDRYLFQSAETTEERIIVTTDTKLMKHFEGTGRYQLWSAEGFMSKFGVQ